MNLDRRQFSRCEPAKLVYARLGKANGGIVLEASMGGLRFHTVAPTQPNELVDVLLSPSPKDSIGLTGKIVWTDDAGKMGGLQFVDPTPQVREQLKNWLLPLMPAEKLESARIDAPLRSSAQPATARIPYRDPAPAATATPLFVLPARHKSRSTGPRMFSSLTATVDYPGKAAVESIPRPNHWFLRGLANLILVGLLLLVPAIYIYNFYPHFAYSVIDRMEKLYRGADEPQQEEQPQNVAPSGGTEPNAAPPSAAAPDSSTGNSPNAAEASSIQSQPGSAPPAVAEEKAPTAAESPAPRTPNGKRLPPQPDQFHQASPPKLPVDTDDPDELWFAVGQGDTNAEVALARLYRNGRNVKKNCEQARVLLIAASKKGNTEAISELRELLKEGCR